MTRQILFALGLGAALCVVLLYGQGVRPPSTGGGGSGTISDGTVTGQTVYWDGDSWEPTSDLLRSTTNPNYRFLAQDAAHTPVMAKGTTAQTAPVFSARNVSNQDFFKVFDTGKICWEGATIDGTNMTCLDIAGDPAGAINLLLSATASGTLLSTGDGALNDDDLSDNSLNDLGTKTENLLTQRTLDLSIATEITLDTNGDATLPSTGGHRKFDTFADAASDTWDTVVCTAGTSGTVMAANDARTIIISETIISNWPLDITLDDDGDIFSWACPSANTMVLLWVVDEGGQGAFNSLQIGAAGTPTNDTWVTDDALPSAPSNANEITLAVDRTKGTLAGVPNSGDTKHWSPYWEECWTVFDTAADLTTGLDVPSIWHFQKHAVKVNYVWCEVDANTITINLQRDDGTAANLLSADLVCDTGGQTSCASGCDVNTISTSEDDFAIGEELDLVTVSLGAARRLNLCVSGNLQ